MCTPTKKIISITTTNIYSASGSQYPIGTITTTVYITK